jgi:hypothetical protein
MFDDCASVHGRLVGLFFSTGQKYPGYWLVLVLKAKKIVEMKHRQEINESHTLDARGKVLSLMKPRLSYFYRRKKIAGRWQVAYGAYACLRTVVLE